MIELEMFVVFFTAIFFTLIYVGRRGVLWGVFCYASWQTISLMWMMIQPMSTSYTIAFLFQAIAIVFLFAVIIGWLQKLRMRGYEESELD